ncbi:uncharacterized protein BO80DRAFT_386431, partial [Aspergillus ibericus CBS 121593]
RFPPLRHLRPLFPFPSPHCLLLVVCHGICSHRSYIFPSFLPFLRCPSFAWSGVEPVSFLGPSSRHLGLSRQKVCIGRIGAWSATAVKGLLCIAPSPSPPYPRRTSVRVPCGGQVAIDKSI